MVQFDAETDSGMVWREQITMVMVDGDWKLTGFFLFHAAMVGQTSQQAGPTLSSFLIASDGSENLPVVAVTPIAGWNMRIDSVPVPVGPLRCDIQVKSGGKKALLEGAYGSCGLLPGAEITVLGLVNYLDERIVIRHSTFVPTRKAQ